ncbi:MAG: FeoB-associated Cys-rich membrane protein [Clostridiales bacterium]|nr:FeoB-associated Cys-rich membrane protein [Clostridiales bacterium]
MLSWISANIGSIIICLVLAAIVVGIVFVLKKDKKKGKSACGGSCCHCPMEGKCHGGQAAEK